MKKSRILKIFLAGLLVLTGCAGGGQSGGPQEAGQLIQTQPPQPGDPIVVMETTMGTIRIRLFPQYAPITVENFIGLAEQGLYNGLIFHRVIDNFMIQGGCPEGTGRGGMSIFLDGDGDPLPFEDEPSDYLWNFRGALSMANAGPNTNRSQFFIVQNSDPLPDNASEMLSNFGYPEAAIAHYDRYGGTPHLDGQFAASPSLHTVFGQVIEGMDVVDAIAGVSVGQGDRPLEDVVMVSVTIETA